MSDGHQLTRLGRPVVVVVQAVFEKAARAQARALGVPDLPICAYTAQGPGSAPANSETLGAEIADSAMRLLLGATRS